MKIVFLDESTLHNGELDLSRFAAFGELICYPLTNQDEVMDRCKDAHTIISNKAVLNEQTIANSPHLKQIISCATGVNQIDLDAAKARGITVQNVAGYSTHSVAQHVWGFILNLATNIHHLNNEAKQWPDFASFSTLKHPVFELQGKVLGIVGLGTIGRAVADIAKAFGMEVQALARTQKATSDGIPRVSAEEFYQTADIISLHCPLTKENENMIDAHILNMMKSSAILINTARGLLINENDLADALQSGAIAAAGLDVLSSEPPSVENPLIQYSGNNLIMTPHTAWSSIQARQILLDGVIENIASFLEGNPSNKIC